VEPMRGSRRNRPPIRRLLAATGAVRVVPGAGAPTALASLGHAAPAESTTSTPANEPEAQVSAQAGQPVVGGVIEIQPATRAAARPTDAERTGRPTPQAGSVTVTASSGGVLTIMLAALAAARFGTVETAEAEVDGGSAL
jgi:hypothetical protein